MGLVEWFSPCVYRFADAPGAHDAHKMLSTLGHYVGKQQSFLRKPLRIPEGQNMQLIQCLDIHCLPFILFNY